MSRNGDNVNKKNIIIFEAQNNHVFEVRQKPIPAVKVIPDWWKNIPKYAEGNSFTIHSGPNVTVKQCSPTMDMFSSGYIVTLWSDVLVRQTDFGPRIEWGQVNFPVVQQWDSRQVNSFQIPNGFDKSVFKYLHGWNILTSPGYSTLFFHPSGYENLPFRSISGIVDTDILKTGINVPFVLKKDFEGVIEKGTPMFQLIPFKREVWDSKYTNPGEEKTFLETQKLFTKLYGAYHSVKSKKIFR